MLRRQLRNSIEEARGAFGVADVDDDGQRFEKASDQGTRGRCGPLLLRKVELAGKLPAS